MLNLNLLSPSERANIAYEFRARAVMSVGAVLSLVCAVAIILLLPTLFLVEFQKSEAVRAVALETASQAKLKLDVDVAALDASERLARAVVRHETDQKTLTPLFEAVIRGTPPAIRLDSIQFRAGSREFALKGFAPTRSSLLEFLSALDRDPLIAKTSSPVSNLIKETEVEFSFTATAR